MNYNLLIESSVRSIDHLIKIKYFTCTLKYAIVIIDKLSLNDKLKKNRKGECTQLHAYTKRFINYLMEIKIHKNVNCISIRSDFRIHNETAVRIANWEEKPNWGRQNDPSTRTLYLFLFVENVRCVRHDRV